MKQTHYTILGVQPDATQAEIKKAYRELAKTKHPDKAGGNAEEFAAIATAYEVLSDPERRKFYDLTGEDDIPSIEKEIRAITIRAFQHALSIDEGLILDNARGFVNKAKGRFLVKEKNLLQRQAKLKKKRNAVKTKAKVNLFLSLVDQELNDIKTMLAELNHDLEVAAGCLTVLEQYESNEELDLEKIFAARGPFGMGDFGIGVRHHGMPLSLPFLSSSPPSGPDPNDPRRMPFDVNQEAVIRDLALMFGVTEDEVIRMLKEGRP